jgi:anti-sigma factor RsiW
MDHQAAQELFSDYLEGELSPQEQQELSAHLQECESCRAELEDLRKTMSSLSGLMTLPPPEGFVSKVQQKIRKRSRGRFFTPERLLMRVPFEWISFIIIMLMLAMYMIMMLGQGAASQPIPPPPPPPPPPGGASDKAE